MKDRLELLVEKRGERVLLRAPEVGTFTCAVPRGQLLAPEARAGVLSSLGRAIELVVPAGVLGRIVSERPERVREPVGYGTTLYELVPLGAEAEDAGTGRDEEAAASGAPAFRAPLSGRFWHRPAPGDPAFVEAGITLAAGQTIGLIEVMKTFTHLSYAPGDALPSPARVTRVCAADGAEVNEGDPLIEVEPA